MAQRKENPAQHHSVALTPTLFLLLDVQFSLLLLLLPRDAAVRSMLRPLPTSEEEEGILERRRRRRRSGQFRAPTQSDVVDRRRRRPLLSLRNFFNGERIREPTRKEKRKSLIAR